VAAQLLLYPVLDARRNTASYRQNAEGYYITAEHLRWFWEQYLGPDPDQAAAKDASPLREEDLENVPGGVVVTAGLDPLRDEGSLYAQRLAEAKREVTLLNYPQAFHGFMGFATQLPLARQAFAALRPALDRAVVAGHEVPDV
jgi:acetyl esterase